MPRDREYMVAAVYDWYIEGQCANCGPELVFFLRPVDAPEEFRRYFKKAVFVKELEAVSEEREIYMTSAPAELVLRLIKESGVAVAATPDAYEEARRLLGGGVEKIEHVYSPYRIGYKELAVLLPPGGGRLFYAHIIQTPPF